MLTVTNSHRLAVMRRTIGIFLVLLLTLSFNAFADTKAQKGPSVSMQPDEVVEILVDALRTNDPDDGDQGIATVWRFAAPSNKSVTGPLPRFTQMLKGGFSDMLNHIGDDIGPLQIEGDIAMQPVWLITPKGDEVGYLFRLRRQSTGEFEGMWMTEAVYPIAPKTPSTTI